MSRHHLLGLVLVAACSQATASPPHGCDVVVMPGKSIGTRTTSGEPISVAADAGKTYCTGGKPLTTAELAKAALTGCKLAVNIGATVLACDGVKLTWTGPSAKLDTIRVGATSKL